MKIIQYSNHKSKRDGDSLIQKKYVIIKLHS